MIIYSVTYAHTNGFGNAEVTTKKEIESFDDIYDIKEVIELEAKATDVVILSFRKLKKLGKRRRDIGVRSKNG